jgi:hypothetical protein
MSVDKVLLRLDTGQTLPGRINTAFYHTISVADAYPQAVYTDNLYYEPFTGTLMIRPLQFNPNSYLDATIPRNGVDQWNLTTAHWDEVQREQERWLLSDGTGETIENKRTLPDNYGFVLKFLVMGSRDDLFTAVSITFGPWSLVVLSDGYAILSRVGETGYRAAGHLTGPGHQRIAGDVLELTVMPVGDGTILIRRNGVAGFSYKVPADELGTPAQQGESPVVIPGSAPGTATAFKLQFGDGTNGIRARFEFTQLWFPYNSGGAQADYTFTAPVYYFAQPPMCGQTVSLDVLDDIPSTGGHTAQIQKPDGSAFAPNGTDTAYQVKVVLAPDHTQTSSPMLQRVTVAVDPIDASPVQGQGDVTADVMAVRLSTGDRVSETVCRFTLRLPDDHAIFGACNRLVALELGGSILFTGVLRNPPKYLREENGNRFYECEAATLSKDLEGHSLIASMQFDCVSHSEAVKRLCYAGNLLPSDLDFSDDETPLPDTRRQNSGGIVRSEFQPNPADKPLDWIERICEQTGWTFTDGYNNGSFVFRYFDPYTLTNQSKHTFVMQATNESAESDGSYGYQRIFGWQAYSIEPQANELYMISVDERGNRIAARYWDRTSQNPTQPSADSPNLPNWLGTRRVVAHETRLQRDMDWLSRMALRAGLEICKRRDFAVFRAEYPADKQLWKYDVVTVWDSDANQKEPGIGPSGKSLYRIVGIREIAFENEFADTPRRTAVYEAVKVGEG